ncbi:ABC transporter substrate-binding protein [Paenibacillus methanolicus]|uniref:Multiple sugar transport system substrate-binding protein n=1 Tax=Paenibacillus methanolicus TaxID=582686 RepID=A0A5S5CJ41_9BACL|nr:sugar ABC transporter substrate-binding protein [Paenibacillus methanolicus]TYP78216.1 multiple sugar transport system substrate-binding protein [Paenibacillus methanolicus]
MVIWKQKWSHMSVAAMLVLSLGVTGCASNNNNGGGNTANTGGNAEQGTNDGKAAEGTNSAGANAGSSADAKSEIEFMGWGGDTEKAVFQKLIDDYMKKYPNKKVKYTVVPPGEYYQKLDTLIAAKKTPDVFYAGGAHFNKLVNSDQLLNLDSLVESTGAVDPNNVWKAGLDRYRFDGKTVGAGSLYGLPKDVGPWAMAYNKDLFDKAGLPYPSAKAGEYTWDDMLAAAQKLTVKNARGKIDTFGIAGFSLEAAVWGNGGDWIDYSTGTVTIDTPEFAEAMQFAADLGNKYKVSPTPDDEKAQNGYARFVAGKIAMFPMGPWDQPGFWNLPFKWDIAAWPASPKTGKTATWLGSLGFVVGKNTDYPEDAFQLAAYLSLDRDSQKQNYELGQAVPNLIDMAKGEFLQMDKAPQTRQVFLDIIEDYGRPPVEVGSKNLKWLDTFNQDASQVWTGKKTAAEFLKEEQPKLQKLYDEGNK